MHLGALALGRLSAGDRPSLLRGVRLLFPVIAVSTLYRLSLAPSTGKRPGMRISYWNFTAIYRISYEGSMFHLFRSWAKNFRVCMADYVQLSPQKAANTGKYRVCRKKRVECCLKYYRRITKCRLNIALKKFFLNRWQDFLAEVSYICYTQADKRFPKTGKCEARMRRFPEIHHAEGQSQCR